MSLGMDAVLCPECKGTGIGRVGTLDATGVVRGGSLEGIEGRALSGKGVRASMSLLGCGSDVTEGDGDSRAELGADSCVVDGDPVLEGDRGPRREGV